MSRKDELTILKQNADAMRDNGDIASYSAKRMLVDREHYLFIAHEIERLQEADAKRFKLFQARNEEIERLRAALRRIDSLNDNPAHYNSEINDVVMRALEPRS